VGAIGDQVHELRENGAAFATTVQHEIEERPLTSMAVAFGAGFLLGKLLDRRRWRRVSAGRLCASRV
jgi:ElaB/YqjD/DUF883 family membrane-anchored ribosome-binding protein